MKKILLLFFSICSLICLQNTVYSKESNNVVITEESPLTEDDIQDSSPYPTYQPQYKPSFLKMFLILVALLALIFLTFWIFKRLMRVRLLHANHTKSIKILEKRAISPKSILYLVEIEGKKVVISESTLEVRKIKDIDKSYISE